MTFDALLQILLDNFADEMVWHAIDQYHADYGGKDEDGGPYTYKQACEHKTMVELRDCGDHTKGIPPRKSVVMFGLFDVSS